jgi:TonB-dependent SusC/RagA subfamily outer membrane receptor
MAMKQLEIYPMQPFFSRKLTLFIFALTVFLTAFRYVSDDGFGKRLIANFLAYSQQRPTEKVYVQTDRDAYLIGETIWLKGYLVNGTTHESDTVSRVLYVELVDPVASRVRLRTQLRATAGYAPGQLLLPDSLVAGTYQLRAYTNFMRNEPDAYFFAKTLTILSSNGDGPGSPPGATVQTRRPTAAPVRVDVQFLPEGGQLVAGIESRVAFKAVGPSGLGVPVRGFVLNTRKDTVTGFASIHLGMGFFTVKPEAGQAYTAFVQITPETIIPYPMPAVQAQGVVMQVDNMSSKEQVKVYVRHNRNSSDEAATLTLLAQTRGQPIHEVSIPLSKKVLMVQLPKKEFPEGIAQLTLFDETHTPACERLIFVNQQQRINITLTPDKKTYKNREKVALSLTTADANGKPVAANLSLVALDTQLAPEADSNSATIVSHLLLSSDLTGTIEQPAWYFDAAHENRWIMLDLLLMTQGWRRFAWSDILVGTIPTIKYPVERGLSLTGRVVRPNGKDIGGKVNLNFMVVKRDSTRDFLLGESDEAGNFGAYDLNFTDTTLVRIQGVKGRANRDLVIQLDQLLLPTMTITKVPYNPVEFQRDELSEFMKRTREYLEIERQIRRNGAVLLNAVTVKAKKYVERDSRVIYSNPDASVKFTTLNSAGRQTILDVIQGQIPGVQVTGSGFQARVQIRGAVNFSGPVEPLFVLDGMPTDLQGVINIPVSDVDRVDVLKGASAAIYGSRGGGGVISVLTKRGAPDYDFTKDVTPGTLLAKLPGYAPVREFYAPRYEAKKPDDARPDYRATLFWAPMIQTDAKGRASVSFFTSDAKNPVRFRAEGITISGMPGVGQGSVKVE